MTDEQLSRVVIDAARKSVGRFNSQAILASSQRDRAVAAEFLSGFSAAVAIMNGPQIVGARQLERVARIAGGAFGFKMRR